MQGNLIFTNRDGNIFPEDDEEDDDYDPEGDDQEDVPLIPRNNDDLASELQDIAGVDDENENDNDNELLVHPDNDNDNDNEPLVHLYIKQENEKETIEEEDPLEEEPEVPENMAPKDWLEVLENKNEE